MSRSAPFISDLERKSRSGSSFSIERLIILALTIAIAALVILWQQERRRPTPSYVVTTEGQILKVNPVDPTTRTPAEVKAFAERTYKGLYKWDYDVKTPGGLLTRVQLAMFGLSGDLAQTLLNVFKNENVFRKVANEEITTQIAFRPTQLVHAEAPYEVVVRGERRLIGRTNTVSASFSKKYTIELSERNDYNPYGLVITRIENLDRQEN